MEVVCVAVLEWRSARRGAKGDAGTPAYAESFGGRAAELLVRRSLDKGGSVERRNDAGARENATRMGRALFARGCVERLARITRYEPRRSPARDAKIAPAQMVQPGR